MTFRSVNGVLRVLFFLTLVPAWADSTASRVILTATPTSTPALKPPCTFVDGWNGYADASGDGNEGYGWATRFTTNGPQTVNSIWVNMGGGGDPDVYVSVGIYQDLVGKPVSLLTSAKGSTQGSYYNSFSIDPIVLEGHYWVACQINSPYWWWSEGVSQVQSGLFHLPWPYTGQLPPVITDFQVTSPGRVWDVFADFCDRSNQTPTPVFTPTATPLPTSTPVPGREREPFVKKGLILAVGNSTTELRGQYLDQIRPMLQAYYGNGGPGLRMFNWGNALNEQDVMTYSSNMKDIWSDNHWEDMPKNYSIDAVGMAAEKASEDWLNYGTYNNSVTITDRSALIYLQQPEGGVFTAGYAPVTSGTQYKPVTVHTNGPLEVKAVRLELNKKDPVLFVNHINGKVCLYGFYALANSGIAATRLANGGTRVSEFVKINPMAMAEWLHLLPDLKGFLIKLGMNDRFDQTGPEFYRNMETLTDTFKANVPGAKIVLINPAEGIDFNKTHLPEFVTQLQNLATVKGYGYFNEVDVLGTYSEALNRFQMRDGIHPNEEGNALIAKYLLPYLGVPTSAPTIVPSPK